MVSVGVAMLQGGRHEHIEALIGAGKEMNVDVDVLFLRTSEDVTTEIDALVIPGGESTAMKIASRHYSLLDALYTLIRDRPHIPVLGTCAGAILLAHPHPSFTPFITAELNRNSWGRQRESFEALLDVHIATPSGAEDIEVETTQQRGHIPLIMKRYAAPSNEHGYPGVFIRAPRFAGYSGSCKPTVFLQDEVVGVVQNNIMALTFHPELTQDRRFHRWLIERVVQRGDDC